MTICRYDEVSMVIGLMMVIMVRTAINGVSNGWRQKLKEMGGDINTWQMVDQTLHV